MPGAPPFADAPIRDALDELIERGPLSVAFQPIVDLARGEAVAYEVLGRCAPLTGLLSPFASSPATLLDVAYAHGRLLALDRRWRTLAIGAIASLAPAEPVRFFLNVDPRVCDDPGFRPGFTRDLTARHGLAADRFVLELTERVALNEHAIEAMLRHYGAQGFHVALDDVPMGPGALMRWLQLRPHVVKLDASLIRGIHADGARVVLASALRDLARETGATLIAEGLEAPEEIAAVSELGIPWGQGWALGRPAAAPAPISRDALDRLRAACRPAPSRGRADEDNAHAMILGLAEALRGTDDLDVMLKLVTDACAMLVGVERVSLRLLDETRTRLLVAARTGPALHDDPDLQFSAGEGLAGWIASNRASVRLDNPESDPRYVVKPGQRESIGSFLGVPLLDGEGCIGVLGATAREPRAFDRKDEMRLRLVASVAGPHVQAARLARLARTDPLTSAFNRRVLDDVLPPRSGERSAQSVLLADVDHFKSVNDRFGHATGDEVLRRVARALTAALRRGDRLIRMGGDEFLVVLDQVDLESAVRIAERAREQLARTVADDAPHVTVSFGIAQRRAEEPREAVLLRVDAALYAAKTAGRDQVVAVA